MMNALAVAPTLMPILALDVRPLLRGCVGVGWAGDFRLVGVADAGGFDVDIVVVLL